MTNSQTLSSTNAHAAALLQWYLEAGVDEYIDPSPCNRFRKQEPAAIVAEAYSAPEAVQGVAPAFPVAEVRPSGSSVPAVSMAAAPLPVSVAEAIARAEALAASAKTLDELEQAVREFDGLAICKTANCTVFADGNPQSELMLLGEAPGMEEDRRGIPFCGPSGKLLDRMMAAIGRDRSRFYISNTVFWRPPGNRQPSMEELAVCRPFMEKHIALVKPRLLVLVGGTAARGVLQEERGITRLRGTSLLYASPLLEQAVPVIATYHPSYLLRQPVKKREAWQDLQTIDRLLQKANVN